MPELKPEAFVEAVRKVVRTLRYGPRELTLATFGVLLLGLSKFLPEPLPKVLEFLKPVLSWIPWVGMLLLALAAWLIWKKAVAPVPEGKPKPPAIKGPAPFGPHDAELFARLGRKDDLDRLRGWILDDQKPLVALMGESGIGKTSLLRAGLESHLKGDSVQVIYWEALPTDPEEGLLHAVQSRWEDSSTAPTSFARLASAVARGRRVIVIDQAEQLSPDRHRAIFEMLRQVATASPPYACTWLVAFRREYSSVWRDFELDLPEPARHRLETLSLRRFLPEQAARVIAVLAEEGAVPIEQKVVKALVESIESEGRVTPADIGISLLVLSEISGDGKAAAFTVEDFRERGGQAGLLTRYLERLLKDIPESERREIFQALLALIDLENDHRLAEGRTPLELVKIARPATPNRFAALLRFLASGKARILEETPEPPLRYRLIHERLIPAIRRLTGLLLAEAEQAGLLLDRAYQTWTKDQKVQYLLSGKDLTQVLRFQEQFAWGNEADHKREYLRLSRQHNFRMWVSVFLSSNVLLMGIVVGFYLYSEHRSHVAADRALLTSWGLPPDVLDHIDQIEQLTLPRGVTRFDWLEKAHRLHFLVITDTNLAKLEELPKGLRTLKIRFSEVSQASELPQLPAGLESLDISGIEFGNLERLPRSLENLTIACVPGVLGRAHFPDTLKSLHLTIGSSRMGSPRIEITNLNVLNLSGLKNLDSLSLDAEYTISIDTLILPDRLRHLTLGSGVELVRLQDLPSELESLSLPCCSPDLDLLPRGLKRLSIWTHGEVRIAAPPLYALNTIGQERLQDLPEGLSKLQVELDKLENLSLLPSTLKELQLVDFDGKSKNIGLLPANLSVLEVRGFSDLNFTQGLPVNLERLALTSGQTSLPILPPNLISLTYLGPLQRTLPASIRSLTIDANNRSLPFLAPLWALDQLELRGAVTKIPSPLPSLKFLDISNTSIRSLQELPPRLASLKLQPGQVDNLKGLPKSVVSLDFSGFYDEISP